MSAAPQEEAAPASTTETRPSIAADDNLSCQWDKCTERCTSAEALFVSLHLRRNIFPAFLILSSRRNNLPASLVLS